MEIERKWLLRQLPLLKPESEKWVNQFYLSTEPEIRLRSARYLNAPGTWEYFITIKGDGDLTREEIESTIDGRFYLLALDMYNCQEIYKRFLIYTVNDKKVEVSVVLNQPNFIYAEVEFASEEEANAYEFPWQDIVEKEVTYDSEYKMKNYWQHLSINNRELSET